MQEEVFGPLLPTLPSTTSTTHSSSITARDSPLALISSPGRGGDRGPRRTPPRAECDLNETLFHIAVPALPFGAWARAVGGRITGAPKRSTRSSTERAWLSATDRRLDPSNRYPPVHTVKGQVAAEFVTVAVHHVALDVDDLDAAAPLLRRRLWFTRSATRLRLPGPWLTWASHSCTSRVAGAVAAEGVATSRCTAGSRRFDGDVARAGDPVASNPRRPGAGRQRSWWTGEPHLKLNQPRPRHLSRNEMRPDGVLGTLGADDAGGRTPFCATSSTSYGPLLADVGRAVGAATSSTTPRRAGITGRVPVRQNGIGAGRGPSRNGPTRSRESRSAFFADRGLRHRSPFPSRPARCDEGGSSVTPTLHDRAAGPARGAGTVGLGGRAP